MQSSFFVINGFRILRQLHTLRVPLVNQDPPKLPFFTTQKSPKDHSTVTF